MWVNLLCKEPFFTLNKGLRCQVWWLGRFLPCSGRWGMLLCVPLLPGELFRMQSTHEGLGISPLPHELCSWGTKGQGLSWSGPQLRVCST